MRKLLAVLCLVTIIGSQYEVSADNEEKAFIEDMVKEGLSEEEARQLFHVDIIIKRLEENNLTVERLGEGYSIINTAGIDVTNECIIGKQDRDFLFEVLERSSKVTHEMMIEDLEKQMDEHSDRSFFRIEYENGSWIQVTRHLERDDEISADELI